MLVLVAFVALRAEVVVLTLFTFVSDPDDGDLVALVTLYSLVNHYAGRLFQGRFVLYRKSILATATPEILEFLALGNLRDRNRGDC